MMRFIRSFTRQWRFGSLKTQFFKTGFKVQNFEEFV